MEERNCYVSIDNIDNNTGNYQHTISMAIMNITFYIENYAHLELTEEGKDFLKHAVGDVAVGKVKGLALSMLELTYSEAEYAVEYFRERHINTRIQYHATTINIENNNTIISSNNSQIITSDLGAMKQYLKDIYTIEKELYCSKTASQKILNKINSLGQRKEVKYDTIKDDQDDFTTKFAFVFLGGFAGAIIGLIGGFISGANMIISGIIGIIFCAVIGYVIGIISAKKEQNQRKEERQNIYNADTERVNSELAKIAQYRKQENLFAQNIASCQSALNQLYSLDIIFPKYRNLIAISQFYEYYMSGRCTQLEGHEGAYNIFESELRQNVIIAQLNDVLANLEEIKRTQYMIYEAIQESNRILSQIESNTAATAYNTSVIAANSAICARYVQS